jgi:hypothetical protein
MHTLLTTLALMMALLQVPNAIATFDGIFKNYNKKYVEIQVESGETMRMFVTRGTKFTRDGHAARATDFHDGDKVVVDAERDLRMNLLAVRVELAKTEVKEKK